MPCFEDVLLLASVLVLGCTLESKGLSTDPVGPEHLKTYYGATPNPGQVTSKSSNYRDAFNDEGWSEQWIAHDFRTAEGPVMDHNLVPVYRMGITGEGVKIGVVDVGFQKNHLDLDDNYIRELFVDLKDKWDFPLPCMKDYDRDHGMHSLGVIAMVANNLHCGVGVAFGTKVAGIKLNFIAVQGEALAQAVSYGIDHFDIYSNSWSSSDKIGVMAQKLPLLKEALRLGVTKGRAGKGTIYVFAAGNGKGVLTNCGTDPIVNMVDTIPIAAASNRGKTTTYSERCAGLFATAYSGDLRFDRELIYTTGLDGSCAKSYSGTSAAVPIASGIIALTLQANPALTYRDVQHLITMSSEVAPLADNSNTWYKNKAGFWVSNDFGFGLLNAKNMVKLAQKWKRVPQQTVCTVKYKGAFDLFDSGSKMEFTINTEPCQKKRKQGRFQHETVNYLELYRGALSFRLRSPSGTESALLEPRMNDLFRDGLKNWKLKSLHTWGENPIGDWTVFLDVMDWLRYQPSKRLDFISKIKNEFGRGASGRVEHLVITLYGTETQPEHLKTARTYSAFRLDDNRSSEG